MSSSTVLQSSQPDVLETAVKLHREGRYSEAFPLYFQVLNERPEDAEIWHLAGLAAFQAGCHDLAENALLKAISFDSQIAEFHVHLAAVLRAQGRLPESITSAKRALHLDPLNPNALFNLGNALAASGDVAGAIREFQKALIKEPNSADIRINLGGAFSSIGKDAEALAEFRHAISINPRDASAHSNAGLILLKQGNPHAALTHFRNAISLEPSNENARLGEARGLVQLGALAEAEIAFRRSLVVLPHSEQIVSEWAGVLIREKRTQEAESVCRRFIELHPSKSTGYVNLSAALRAQRDPVGAEAAALQAVKLDPSSEAARINLAVAHLDQGRHDEAASDGQALLEIHPQSVEGWFLLGAARHADRKLESASQAYERACALDPKRHQAWCNWGAVLRDLGRPQDAIPCYDRALALAPEDALSRFNRSCARLALGQWKEGWEDYESRWNVPGLLPSLRPLSAPRWTGEPLSGQRLIIQAEQGFGDTLQFVRYAQHAAHLGAEVLLEVPPALKSLLGSAPGVHRVFTHLDPAPQADYSIPLLGLPRMLAENFDQSGLAHPYLAPASSGWKPPSTRRHPLRIGIVWAGSSQQKENALRSIPWTEMSSLIRIGNIDWVSFQVGERTGDAQAEFYEKRLADWGATFRDFADTSAAIIEVDLVITVCTATAHLAGALNAPVWTLLHHAPCWRWGLQGNTTPWYPSMRLFRQREAGRWDKVMADVRQAVLDMRDRTAC